MIWESLCTGYVKATSTVDACTRVSAYSLGRSEIFKTALVQSLESML